MSNSKSKKELRSLQDLMTKMDNLTKSELAADCQGEPDEPLIIPFSHTVIVPAGYTVGVDPDHETVNRLTYNIANLHCQLAPCDIACNDCCRSMPSGLKGFQVSIVGCIPYNICVTPVIGDCGGTFTDPETCTGDLESGICYHDCIGVDKKICCIYAGIDEYVWPVDFVCPLDDLPVTPEHNPLNATFDVSVEVQADGTTKVVMYGDFTIPTCPPDPSQEA